MWVCPAPQLACSAGSSEQLAWLLGIFSYRPRPHPPLELGPPHTHSRGLGFCQPLGQAGGWAQCQLFCPDPGRAGRLAFPLLAPIHLV